MNNNSTKTAHNADSQDNRWPIHPVPILFFG